MKWQFTFATVRVRVPATFDYIKLHTKSTTIPIEFTIFSSLKLALESDNATSKLVFDTHHTCAIGVLELYSTGCLIWNWS